AHTHAFAPDIVGISAITGFELAGFEPLHQAVEIGRVIGNETGVFLVRGQDGDAGFLAAFGLAAVLLERRAQRCGNGDTTLVVHHLQPNASIPASCHARPLLRTSLPRPPKRTVTRAPKPS